MNEKGHEQAAATYLVTAGHDTLQFQVNLRGRPSKALAILGHLEAGDRDTTRIGGL
jgi:hypothetical protein